MRVAAIDVGTNSTRLLLAEVVGGRVSTIETDLITTRLGQGINQGYLLTEAMERTIAAIVEFIGRARAFGSKGIKLAATSAVRDAQNKDEFLRLTRERTGLDVRVLTGPEEAAASYAGVLSGLPIDQTTTLVLDVGGGSTEFIWPEPQELRYISRPVGAVRMTEGKHSDEQIRELLAQTIQQIKNQQKVINLVAVGGTATTLAAVSLGLERYRSELVHGHYLPLTEIERLLGTLEQAGAEGRKKIIGLQPQRADIILAGVRIVKIILEGLALQGLTVSDTDILQGMALEFAQSLSE